MDKIKTYDRLLRDTLKSLLKAQYERRDDRNFANKLYDDIIKALNTPDEAEPDNGWISVEERLPEIGEHYCSKLVMCYSPDGEHEYLFDYYEVNGFGQGCFTTEKYFGITITHWQPLPEPPKGECK